ncbi:MAG: hypothetical protein MUC55_11800 [Burkholderiales bacterium]|jgi:hypothetical protein|nr:hypothetical protein [Burkholderiales bacterium]
MASRRKRFLTIAWLASWALILVFASRMPGWLAISMAVATFAAFLLFSRESSACIAGQARSCETGGPASRDGAGARPLR